MLSITGALRARITESMRRPVALLAAALLALATAPAALAQSSFTWTGAASDQNWSDASNWAGAVAPSGTVGTLNFPRLTSAACAASRSSAACYQSNNDLSGIRANALSINDNDYYITGNAITLGSGGLTATPSGTEQFAAAALRLPIALSAPQSWTIDGAAGVIVSNVTGDQPLRIDLSNGGFLDFPDDAEVGAVTASGSGTLELDGSLNGTDGNTVSLVGGAGLSATFAGAQSGPLSVSGGNVQVGDGFAPDGTLAVAGAVTLDPASTLSMYIDQPGTTPSTDFSQLSATGNIDLGRAMLSLAQGDASFGGCVDLTPGQVDTLITTTGSLSGELTDSSGSPIANGDTVTIQDQCDHGHVTTNANANATINYTSSAVTATIKTAGHAGDVPQNTSPPTISGTAQQGDTLSASNGSWTNSPTSYAYRWQRCNPGCQNIPGARAATYKLVAGDRGVRVRVVVTASNSAGGAYAISGEVGPVTAPGLTVQAIRRALGMIHPPLGGAASIPQLLRHHGYRLLFAAPAAGLLQVGWYTPVKIRVKVRGRHGTRTHFRIRTVLRLIAGLTSRTGRRGEIRRMLRLTPAGVRLLRHARNRVVIERLAFTPAHQGATRLERRFRLRR